MGSFSNMMAAAAKRAETDKELRGALAKASQSGQSVKSKNKAETPSVVKHTTQKADTAAGGSAGQVGLSSEKQLRHSIKETSQELEQLREQERGRYGYGYSPEERRANAARRSALESQLETLQNQSYEQERKARLGRLSGAALQNEDYTRTLAQARSGELPLSGNLRLYRVANAIKNNSFYDETDPWVQTAKGMSQRQRDNFLYYAAKGDYESAQTYLEDVARDINRKQTEQTKEQVGQFAQEHPVLGAAAQIGAGFLTSPAMLANAFQVAENAVTGKYVPTDVNSPAFRAVHVQNAAGEGVQTAARQAAVKATGSETAGNVAGFLAGTGMSIGQNVAQAALLGPFALGAMGVNAAATATTDALERGASPARALGAGSVQGAIEVVTEKIPIDNLFKLAKEGGPSVVKAAVSQILPEALGEGISQVAGTMADTAMMGDRSEYRQYVSALMEEGLGKDEAEKAAFLQFYVYDTLLSAAGGGLSGGVMGAGAALFNRAGTYARQQVKDEATAQAMERAEAKVEQSTKPVTLPTVEKAGAAQNADMSGVVLLPGMDGQKNTASWRETAGGTSENGAPLFKSETIRNDGPLRSDAPLGDSGDPLNAMIHQQKQGVKEQTAQVSPEDSTGAAPLGFDPYSHLQNQTSQFHADGEKAYRQVDVPTKDFDGRNIPKSTATVMEAQATPDSAVGVIQDAIAKGQFSFDTNTDKGAAQRARSTVEDKGWDGALEYFHEAAKRGVLSKDNVALGALLLNNAMNSRDSQTVVKLLTDYASMSTTAAQSLQAQRMLKKMSPEWQLYGIQRSVGNMQEELVRKYGDKAPDLTIPDELVQRFLDSTDEEARKNSLEDIYQSIAQQMPANLSDRWNAWRYFAMLANPRTHVRNFFGNAAFAPVRGVKNATAYFLETMANGISGGKVGRTKGFLLPIVSRVASESDRALIKAAYQDAEVMQDMISGEGKFTDSPAGKIQKKRKIFMLPGLERVRQFNSDAMEFEDTLFSSPAYAGALAGYMKANGETFDTASGEFLDEARAYAVREAQRATYRDANALSDFVSGLRYRGDNPVGKGANILLEGVLPFRKTPANILMRGVEYSPIGLIKGLSYDLFQVKNGTMTAAQAIDNISAGLTGTGLVALGAWLASMGLVSGGGSGDDEKKTMDDLTGGQPYAITIGDKNYTLDWLAPEALPFFVGVEAANLWADRGGSGGRLMPQLTAALSSISEPMLEMSMLSGLQDLLESIEYSDNKVFGAISAAAESYVAQALPTLLGQIERVGETQRESTFIDRTSPLTNDQQYYLGKVMNKLPSSPVKDIEFQQMPYIDAWGRTESTGSVGERIVGNMLAPWYASENRETAADREIQRLLEAGQTGVAPSKPSMSDKVNNQYLSQEQYISYATTEGRTSYEIVSDMINSDIYRAMSDEDKAKAIRLAYQYASAVGKEAATNGAYAADPYVAKTQKAQSELGLSSAEYLLLCEEYGKSVMGGEEIRKAHESGMDVETWLDYQQGRTKQTGDSGVTILQRAEDIRKSGMSRDEQTLTWLLEYPDWAEKAEKAGVSYETYIDFKVASYGCTKKAEFLRAINGLNISREEKDALYRAKGYAASGIWSVPWR